MSLFDDLLASIRGEPKRKVPCLIIGCDFPQESEGLCTRHNRDVIEPDPLEGIELPKGAA